jgi:hypothetical protein
LNFVNSEFIIKKKVGRNTFGTERYFKCVEEKEKENEIVIPRGFAGRLIRFAEKIKLSTILLTSEKNISLFLLLLMHNFGNTSNQ